MDIVWSLGLIVVLLLALNHMAGGRASNVLRPVTGIVSNLVSMVVRAVVALLGSVLRIGAGSVTLPKPGGDTKETGTFSTAQGKIVATAGAKFLANMTTT